MNSKELAILMSGMIVALLFIMVGAITLEGYTPTMTKLKLAAPLKSTKKDGFAQSPIYLLKTLRRRRASNNYNQRLHTN